jgi:hypothetical protein
MQGLRNCKEGKEKPLVKQWLLMTSANRRLQGGRSGTKGIRNCWQSHGGTTKHDFQYCKQKNYFMKQFTITTSLSIPTFLAKQFRKISKNPR